MIHPKECPSDCDATIYTETPTSKRGIERLILKRYKPPNVEITPDSASYSLSRIDEAKGPKKGTSHRSNVSAT